ncbi:hypothetical protein [Pseudaestuariivita rosea]|uniref:hypothetical protein n=1 Tax=Pseudaestuariivita rosea TaxID=2763263 RepID=UPI001ABB4D42|nr:hypothetical protein [Pseudaestuariivita rosea]
MVFDSFDQFLKQPGSVLGKGPIALIFLEDDVEVASTLRHHISLGFQQVLAIGAPGIAIDPALLDQVTRISEVITKPGLREEIINKLIAAAPGVWFYYCFNAEYLFFPFCETRSIGEMLTFHTEERREAMLSYVIDLYAEDLAACPNAVSVTAPFLDKSGYYAIGREDAENDWAPKDRQHDFFGGLKWRFEEHVPQKQRRIDRIAIFKSKPGLKMLPGHLFNDEEYNTYACPWHHNLTAAICSFRTAKALRRNPRSRHEIGSFKWHNSVQFEWSSMQLMNLGLMEPGQWF